MTAKRALLLDEETIAAARELARLYACSTPEAIRRSVLRHRDAVLGIPPARREERVQVLDRLFDLFKGHNPEDEIRRLKAEDEYFLIMAKLDPNSRRPRIGVARKPKPPPTRCPTAITNRTHP